MAEATRRELISAAWDKAEEADKPEEKEEVKDEPKEELVAPEEDLAKTDEPEGGEGKEPKEEKPEDSYTQEQKAAKNREQPQKGEKQPATDRAPVAWKPAQREQWAKLPADVRAEINRRETQIQQTLTQTDNVRKFANDFAQTVQPYAHLIRQQNATPLQAVDNLMKTTARLMTGNMEQKAQVVAEIIGNHGIDLETLDLVLSKIAKDGKVPSAVQQQEQPPPWARPMFDFMNTVQQSRQQAEERSRTEAAIEIEKFEEKPFFDDLREEIADIMEVAGNRGRKMTLGEAYTKAVALNPEISAILSQRKKASMSASEAGSALARARRAASTVNGAPTGSNIGAKGVPKTRREVIEQAWDDSESA